MKKKIALMAGGYSGEYAISIQTAATICRQLHPEKYEVYLIVLDAHDWHYTDQEGRTYSINRNDFTLALPEGILSFDAVFIAVHGTPGEDGKLQGYLEMLNIPFTSCGAIVSGITFNKYFCNHIVRGDGHVTVAPSCSMHRDRPYPPQQIIEQLGLPVFVKPAEGGSSLATTKVKEIQGLKPALDAVFRMSDQALIESFIPGREFSIGVYRSKGVIHTLPPTEIISSKEFFDYEAKYTPGVSREVTPADLTHAQNAQLAEQAAYIYELLLCRGVCRVDFILHAEKNKFYFLEINTIPGQSEQSIVPQQVRAAGLTLSDFYSTLLDEALHPGSQPEGA